MSKNLKTVVVISNNSSIVDQAEAALKCFNVIKIRSDSEAISLLKTVIPDFVILDDATEGYAIVLKYCRVNELLKSIPMLMLTHASADRDIFHGFGQGLDTILTRPFSSHELLLFVSRALTSIDAQNT